MSSKSTKKPGRPKTTIDLEQVEKLASIQCTDEEIAQVLGCSQKTIQRHRKYGPELDEAINRGKAKGKASLRRTQWKAAEAGNSTMLVWLGKQYLGQKDKSELTGEDGGALIVELRQLAHKPTQ